MQAITDYFYSTMGMIINSILLLGLIGLMLYLRNKQSDE